MNSRLSPCHRWDKRQFIAVAQHLIRVGVVLVDRGHRWLHVIAQFAVPVAETLPNIRGARALGHVEHLFPFAGDVVQNGEVEEVDFQTPISFAISSNASRTKAMCSSRSTPSSATPL